ncbi:MAG: preprotein translocase subunit SecG [Verrucomicrobiales bacterium]|nr:preprotein translocase subunit SecG [Verrucomicrobiales bacterium]
MAILSILLTVIIIAVSILMVLIVLVQRPKQEGLGAAFGGSTLDSALGAHTTDILQKITTWLGIIFFVSAIGLAMIKTRQFGASAASDVLEKVETREPELPEGFPGLAPSATSTPGLDTPAPEAPIEDGGTTTPNTGFDLPGGDAQPGESKPADAAPAESAPAAPAEGGSASEEKPKE